MLMLWYFSSHFFSSAHAVIEACGFSCLFWGFKIVLDNNEYSKKNGYYFISKPKTQTAICYFLPWCSSAVTYMLHTVTFLKHLSTALIELPASEAITNLVRNEDKTNNKLIKTHVCTQTTSSIVKHDHNVRNVYLLPNIYNILLRHTLTLQESWNGSIVLELVEGPLQHVLRINFLHTQQVQHHVVGQVECRIQGISRTLKEGVNMCRKQDINTEHKRKT